MPTVQAFQERWLTNDAEATNRPSTISEKKSDLRNYIVPFFGPRRLDAIGVERLARLVERACKRLGLRVIRRHHCRHSFAAQLVPSPTRFRLGGLGGAALPHRERFAKRNAACGRNRI